MLWFLLIISYVVFVLFLHVFACYKFNYGTVFGKFIVVGTIVGVGLLFNVYYLYGLSVTSMAAALTYAFICELYIFTFSFVASSISVSILLRVAKGAIDINVLYAEYSGKIMVENRVRRMHDIGLFIERDKSLQLTRLGQYLMQRFYRLQIFFKFKNV